MRIWGARLPINEIADLVGCDERLSAWTRQLPSGGGELWCGYEGVFSMAPLETQIEALIMLLEEEPDLLDRVHGSSDLRAEIGPADFEEEVYLSAELLTRIRALGLPIWLDLEEAWDEEPEDLDDGFVEQELATVGMSRAAHWTS